MARIAPCLLSLLLAASSAAAAEMGTARVEVDVQPSPLPVYAGKRAQAVVTATNRSTMVLQDVGLSFPGGSVEVEPGQPQRVPVAGSVHWLVTVSRDEEAPPGQLPWLLRYTAGEGAGAAPGARAGSLQFVDPPAPPDPVKVEVLSKLSVLEDVREGGLAFLKIENLTDRPLVVTGVDPHSPYFVRVLPVVAGVEARPCSKKRADAAAGERDRTHDLPPRSSLLLPYSLAACRVVEPGDHLVAWEVAVAERRSGAIPRRVFASHGFKAQVLGESALLQAVKVPSLLLLPGVLVLLTIGFLRHRVHRRDPSAKRFGLDEPDFWILAVGISVVVGLLYPVVTRRLGDPRDYLVSYGIRDIFNLWLASMAIGGVGYVAWHWGNTALDRMSQTWREWRHFRSKQRYPQPGDRPLDVLEKLADAKRDSVKLPQVMVQGTEPWNALVLDAPREGLPLLAPPILVHCNSAECYETLTRLMDGPVAPLLEEIRAELARGGVTHVEWDAEGPTDGPVRLDPGEGWRDRPEPAPRHLVEVRQ